MYTEAVMGCMCSRAGLLRVMMLMETKTQRKDDMKLKKEYGFWSSLKGVIFRVSGSDSQSNYEYSKAVAKVEGVFHPIAIQIGRYIVTMMSTGVILAVGFLLSGWLTSTL
ncbi:hypothetical protein Patl1_13247 [Pistacia atlantica]|uniref:Uncharacterized protein n=1 Tax=Pistacia atlantica TaxID=434234 RepID=A0ACC1ATJ6_9ROSI|nr:hypothetical protein Patl1_13247 [Pistacia atlantica]